MSAGAPDGESVEEKGVVVEKALVTERFDHPAVEVTIGSEREEPVRVQVIEDLSEDLDPEGIGFHPDLGAEFWSREGRQLVFERVFGPTERFVTVYGGTGLASTIETLAEQSPQLWVTPIEDPEAVGETLGAALGQDADDKVRDLISGQRSTIQPGAETEPETADAASSAPIDDAETAAPDEGPPAETESPAVDVAQTLAEQVRSGDLSAADRQALQDAFAGTGDAQAAQIEQLQSEVADLRAYTEALEEFLEADGSPRRRLTDLEDRVDSLDQTVSELDRGLAEHVDALEALEREFETVNEVPAQVERMETRVAELAETVEDLDGFRRNFHAVFDAQTEASDPDSGE